MFKFLPASHIKINSFFDIITLWLPPRVESKPKYKKYFEVLGDLSKRDVALIDSFLISLRALGFLRKEEIQICSKLVKICISKTFIKRIEGKGVVEAGLIILSSFPEDIAKKLSASDAVKIFVCFHFEFIKNGYKNNKVYSYMGVIFLIKLRKFILFGNMNNAFKDCNKDFVNILAIIKGMNPEAEFQYFEFIVPMMPIPLSVNINALKRIMYADFKGKALAKALKKKAKQIKQLDELI